MKKADIVSGILVLLIAGYVFVESGRFPQDAVLLLGPAFFPRLLAGGLVVLGIGLIVMALAGRSLPQGPDFEFAGGGVRRALIALGTMAVYTLLLPTLGFILDSFLLLLVMMRFLGLRSYPKMLLVSAAVTAAVFFVFHTFLKIALPTGLVAF